MFPLYICSFYLFSSPFRFYRVQSQLNICLDWLQDTNAKLDQLPRAKMENKWDGSIWQLRGRDRDGEKERERKRVFEGEEEQDDTVIHLRA